MTQRIISVSNPRVKDVVRLQTSGSLRREAGVFCVERERELSRAIEAGFKVVELYFVPGEADPGLIDTVAEGEAELIEVSPEVLQKIAYQENPQGFVAVLRQRRLALSDLELDANAMVVVCSGVEKPGNTGAILRSADGAGIAAVVIDSEQFDLYNPNCIRASTGAVFWLPVVCAPKAQVEDWLKQQGVRIVAADPNAGVAYTDFDFAGGSPKKVAIVVGSEAQGLDASWRQVGATYVSIPMRGKVDSLNVSVSAALLMFEAARQRRTK